MYPLLTSFVMVALGEIGDKSQLLALALAGRYPAGQVMAGITLATAFLEGLAVGMGTWLAAIIPVKWISVVAGLSFLLFGLWTLRGEEEDAVENRASRFGPLLTVVLAFIVAEMGDKTQLATVALAASSPDPLPVFFGATAGMVAADSIGVLLGDVLLQRLSPRWTKILPTVMFMAFGFLTLLNAVDSSPASWAILGCLAIGAAVLSYRLLQTSQPGKPDSAAGEAVQLDLSREAKPGSRNDHAG